MTTYRHDIKILKSDFPTLKAMMEREWWADLLKEVLGYPTPVEDDDEKLNLSVGDLEHGFLCQWLSMYDWSKPPEPPRDEHERHVKERFAEAFKAAEAQLNSCLNP